MHAIWQIKMFLSTFCCGVTIITDKLEGTDIKIIPIRYLEIRISVQQTL